MSNVGVILINGAFYMLAIENRQEFVAGASLM